MERGQTVLVAKESPQIPKDLPAVCSNIGVSQSRYAVDLAQKEQLHGRCEGGILQCFDQCFAVLFLKRFEVCHKLFLSRRRRAIARHHVLAHHVRSRHRVLPVNVERRNAIASHDIG